MVYIVFGRFERLSFDRKEKYVLPNAKKCLEINEEVKEDLKKIKKVQLGLNWTYRKRVNVFLGVTLGLLFISVIVAMFTMMNSLFFDLLILCRGMHIVSPTAVISKITGFIQHLSNILHFSVTSLLFPLYPIFALYEIVSHANPTFIYSLVTVTCEGAKSPIELFIDCVVLGIVITFIKSNYHLLWTVTLFDINKSMVLKNWFKQQSFFDRKFIVCVFALVFTSVNPFLIILRYFLSMVNFGAFFSRFHIMHNLSPACISIVGYHGQELTLVYTTSILIWLLLIPMLYMTAEIVCPAGGREYLKGTSVQDMISHPSFPFEDNELEEKELEDEDYELSEQSSVQIDDSPRQNSPVYFKDSDLSLPEKTIEIIESTPSSHLIASSKTSMKKKKHSSKSFFIKAFIYTRFMLMSTFAVDLWLAYSIESWVKYLQKLHKIEQHMKKRANQRWQQNIIIEAGLKYQNQKQSYFNTNKWNEYYQSFDKFVYDHEEQTKDINKKWKKHAKERGMNLPRYSDLCFMVYEELQKTIHTSWNFNYFFGSFFLFIFAFLGIGHYFSSIGRRHWRCVLHKYYLFFSVCMGYWTDEALEAYELESLATMLSNEEKKDAIAKLLPLVVGSRAILFQALGTVGTLYSVVVISQCNAPLFNYSPKLQMILPPLICWNARELALERELSQGFEELFQQESEEVNGTTRHHNVQEWILNFMAINIFFTDSRLISFIGNLLTVSLAFILLFQSNLSRQLIVLILICLIPYFLAASLAPIVFFGKLIQLSDEDILRAKCGWLFGLWSSSNKNDMRRVVPVLDNIPSLEISLRSGSFDSEIHLTPNITSRLISFSDDNTENNEKNENNHKIYDDVLETKDSFDDISDLESSLDEELCNNNNKTSDHNNISNNKLANLLEKHVLLQKIDSSISTSVSSSISSSLDPDDLTVSSNDSNQSLSEERSQISQTIVLVDDLLKNQQLITTSKNSFSDSLSNSLSDSLNDSLSSTLSHSLSHSLSSDNSINQINQQVNNSIEEDFSLSSQSSRSSFFSENNSDNTDDISSLQLSFEDDTHLPNNNNNSI